MRHRRRSLRRAQPTRHHGIRRHWSRITTSPVAGRAGRLDDLLAAIVPEHNFGPPPRLPLGSRKEPRARRRAVLFATQGLDFCAPRRDLRWKEAAARLLPATDLTIAGIVKHLAWAEDRWFQGRLLGVPMPAPWNAPGADDPDRALRLDETDTVDGIAAALPVGVRSEPSRCRPMRFTRPSRSGSVIRRWAGESALDPRPHDRRDRTPCWSP